MRLGLFTDAFHERPLPSVLDWLAQELPAVRDLELGTGGYSPAPHCDSAALLGAERARRELLGALASRGLQIAALNASGNPLERPDHDRALRDAVRLARELGVERVVCMSGGRPELSGGGWFPELEDATERYWSTRVLPYWEEVAALAGGELRLCLELEPGSAVYNVSTFERLADAGSALAVNVDPSHLFWQSMDPIAVVRRLGDRIGFVHGKDTVLAVDRIRLDGMLDRTSWRYATVGHGHDASWWGMLLAVLRAAGYDGVVSIEYEDPIVPPERSIAEAAGVLAAFLD